jgi:hypothetical protein
VAGKEVGHGGEIVPGDDQYLKACRNYVAASGKVPELIEQGNAKDVSDPRLSYDRNTTFAEIPSFRKVTRILVTKAHVEFADGRPLQATKSLLSALRMAGKIQRSGSYLHYLSGYAMESAAMAGFDQELTRIPLGEWAAVKKECQTILSNAALQRVLTVGLETFKTSLVDLMDGPPASEEELGERGEESVRIYNSSRRLSLQDRLSLRSKVVEAVRSEHEWFATLLDGQEQTWLAHARTSPNEDPVIAFWASLDSSSVPEPALKIELRRRTQLRLLIAHSLVQKVRWETGLLPASLGVLEDQNAVRDPLTGNSFMYKLDGSTYELYSQGLPETGRIDLVYNRARVSDEADGPETIKP